MVKQYFVLATKNVRRRGLRSWLTMLGIFIGIAAVVSLVSLGDGLRHAVLGQFASLGTDKLTVTNAETGFGPPGATAIKKLTQHDVDIIKQVSGVDMVVPRILRVVKIEYNNVVNYGYAASMPKDSRQLQMIYDTFAVDTQSGRLLGVDDRGKVLLGSNYATDKSYGRDITAGSKLMLQDNRFDVIGILKPTGTFEINLAIMMPEDDLKRILNIGDEYDVVAVRVAKGENIETVADNIKARMRRDRGEKEGEEDFNVQTPINMLKNVNLILNIVNLVVAAIAGISLVVGGIGIANTMYTSVLERTREVGIMKAVGARNSDIMLIFLFEAGLLGFIGGVVGAAMGVGISFGLAAIVNAVLGTKLFVVTFSLPLVLGAFFFSFIIGIVCGVLPAIQASKLRPVDALRA